MIIVLLIVSAVIALVLAVKIKAVVRIEQCRADATLIFLKVIRLKWRFSIVRDRSSIMRIVLHKKDGKEKTMISLAELICRLDKKKRTHQEKARSAGFTYAYEKALIHIRAEAKIGLGDAFATAMVCGALQSGFDIASIIGKPRHHRIKLAVRPVFTKQTYSFCADCIITLAPVNIIVGYIIYQKKLRR